MEPRHLADLVVLVHFAFLLFVIFGGLLGLWWRRAHWLHLPAVLWGGYVEMTGRICPLTPLENRLRRAEGAGEYAGSCIEHYIVPVIYPSGLTRSIQLGLGIGLIVLNVIVYSWVARRRKARSASGSGLSTRDSGAGIPRD